MTKLQKVYFTMIDSNFEQNKKLKLVKDGLKNIKEEVNNLVYWNKKCTDECNLYYNPLHKEEYNQDYLELQRLINKVLKEENK